MICIYRILFLSQSKIGKFSWKIISYSAADSTLNFKMCTFCTKITHYFSAWSQKFYGRIFIFRKSKKKYFAENTTYDLYRQFNSKNKVLEYFNGWFQLVLEYFKNLFNFKSYTRFLSKKFEYFTKKRVLKIANFFSEFSCS